MLIAQKVRLLVVDDHEIIRLGPQTLIRRQTNLEFVGSAADGLEGVDLAHRLCPDVVIMDIAMPLCGGLEATSRLRKELPDTRVLAHSYLPSADVVSAILRAGALGFVSKASPQSVLIGAISVVALGKRFLDPALTDPRVRNLLHDEPMGSPSMLSPREREVLQRVFLGFANKESGNELGLSAKTVEGYWARACNKLSLADRPAIVQCALMAGWMHQQAG